jgi:hypothetical protein
MQVTAIGDTQADGEEVIMLRARRIVSWAIGLAAICLAVPADAQNIDAGKSSAQIFADTCSACHRRPQELKRTSASFLRSHYTTGSDEASAMANYLSGIPADPRAGQQKRQPGSTPPEAIPTRRQEPKDQPKEQAKSPQAPGAASKGRRTGNAEAKAPAAAPPPPAPEVKPPEPPPEAAPPPPPPLEPFEE